MPTPDREQAATTPTIDPLLGFTADGITLESVIAETASSRTYQGRGADGHVVHVWIAAAALARDTAFLARLHQEAQHLATVRHVHVETCLGLRTWNGPGGRPVVALVSEASSGVVLGDLARREPLPVRDVLRVFQQTCGGLAAAHRLGIVHGDVTPDAILVTTGGAAKLRSFALGVSGFSVDGADHRLIGTPDFMAPEVGRGQQPSALSDLYSLGAALVTVLIGELPFPAATALEAIHLNGNAPVPDLASSHPEFAQLAPLVVRLMAKDPASRWMDTDDLARELLVLSGQVAGDLRCRPWKGRRPMHLAARVQTVLTQRPDLQPAALPTLPPSGTTPPSVKESTSGGTTTISRKSVEYFRNPDLFKPAVNTPAGGSPILPSPTTPVATAQPSTTRTQRRVEPLSSGSVAPLGSPGAALSTAATGAPPKTASYLSQLAAKNLPSAGPVSPTVVDQPRGSRVVGSLVVGGVLVAIAITAVVLGMGATVVPSSPTPLSPVVAPPPLPVVDAIRERIQAISELAVRDPVAALAQAEAVRRDHPTADLALLPVALRLEVHGPAMGALQVTSGGQPVAVSPAGLMCRVRGAPMSLRITAPGYHPQEVLIPASQADEVVHGVTLLDEARWIMPAFAPTWVKLMPSPAGVLLASDRKVVLISSTEGREIARLDHNVSSRLPESTTWASVLSSHAGLVRLAVTGGLCIEAGLADLTPVRELHRGQSSVLALQMLPLTLRLGEEGIFLVEREASGFVVAADNRERRLWSRPLKGHPIPWFSSQGDHLVVITDQEFQRLSQEGEDQGRWMLPHPRTGEPIALGQTALLVPTAGGLLRVDATGAMRNLAATIPVTASAGDGTTVVIAQGGDLAGWRVVADDVQAVWTSKEVVLAPRRLVHLTVGDGRIAAADDSGVVRVFDLEGKPQRTIRPGAALLAPPLIRGAAIVVVMTPGIVAAF